MFVVKSVKAKSVATASNISTLSKKIVLYKGLAPVVALLSITPSNVTLNLVPATPAKLYVTTVFPDKTVPP